MDWSACSHGMDEKVAADGENVCSNMSLMFYKGAF